MKLIILLTLIISTSAFSIPKTICGRSDDRVFSQNPKIARILKSETGAAGCTATMISKSCAITAGHCVDYLNVAEFETPKSRNGKIQHPSTENIYKFDTSSIQHIFKGYNDWAIAKVLPNKITGKLAGVVQGYYEVSYEKPMLNEIINITGYGKDASQPTRNFAQQTHNGQITTISKKSLRLHYDVDTMGGNSGSSIILQSTGKIIGIHTRGGCSSRGGANSGTLIFNNQKLIDAIKACLATE